ncbi:Gfo/Idh/MocA family oxidoreductase [Rubellicoccus peritrichatus]|uniref:Gfo/Idh/MocA family oxidoreductase n=1 Tax=Rubellicoccus peritrichatus TaxID=3080537 RepID=A0AAQ3LA51_9BACT|nr:Gfo/Idh/MocA family oxidoreductase [Puniceicoccus sp. CR14]WOO39703.1 Gfo/Idh/MocA family oxidoreductase [Puniceicoccus sp. CR14]
MSKSSKVRLGIVGMGGMGTAHAKSIIAGEAGRIELTAVCDRKIELMKPFEDAKHFDDSDAMIASGEIDAILICTPHYSHTTIGIAALEAGLHVLVEKPISVHKADCERLIAAHTNKKQIFAAMFNQRTTPAYIKLRELIKNGELGKIQRINWIITDWFRTDYYYASGDWRATWGGEGGGVLLNQCPHQLDLWQWLFGMPSKVKAFCQIGRFHDIEVEDDVTAYLEYENGATGVFITTTGEAPGTNRLEVVGENGKMVLDGRDSITFTRNEVSCREFCATADTGFDTPDVWNVEIPIKGENPQHKGILKNFAEAILEGAELLAPAEEGIHSVELANSMLYSTFTDSTVELPLDGAAYEAVLKKKIETSTFVKKTVEVTEVADLSGTY